MPIVVRCTGCGKPLQAPDQTTGKQVRCPHCLAVLSVPAVEPPPIPQLSAPPTLPAVAPPPNPPALVPPVVQPVYTAPAPAPDLQSTLLEEEPAGGEEPESEPEYDEREELPGRVSRWALTRAGLQMVQVGFAIAVLG